MSDLLKVGQWDIKLGEPLPYSVFDGSGKLLLKAGYVINLERHLEQLIVNGLYAQQEAVYSRRAMASATQAEHYNSFAALDQIKIRLERLFEHFKSGKAHENFVERIDDLAAGIQEACEKDTDSALANLHLDYDSSYAVVHHLQAAILCELIAKKLDMAKDERRVLISAALTHDLGLLDIQDKLDRQCSPLEPEQRARINSHPVDSAKLLEHLGIGNPDWLDTVRHHHERLDGSGYADKLSGDRIRLPTRILALADIYSAMVRDRPYRRAKLSREAMRSLLVEQGEKVDSRLIQLMIKEVGVFPPGAIVKLTNGDIGVVKQRQENSAHPIVYAFIKPDGMPMMSPMRRDTVRPEYHVEGFLPFSDYRSCITLIRGLWIQNSSR